VTLSNEVEGDEAYVVAGHKGQPEVVKSKSRQGRRRRRKDKAGRGTLEKETPLVFGMMQRGGQVVINLLANVQQKTIEPFIKDTIDPGTRVYTDNTNSFECLCTLLQGTQQDARRPLQVAQLFFRLGISIAFMPTCVLGDTTIRVSTTAGASTPEMTMATAFVKSM
jgi:ISXO2-like transposase domain